jgi:GNAT superfamily N-acetyltransferase
MARAARASDLSVSAILPARLEHLAGVKRLADRFKRELGFLHRAALQRAIEAQCVLVLLRQPTNHDEQEDAPPEDSRQITLPVETEKQAPSEKSEEPEVVGMVHFYLRRDHSVTLSNIVVAQAYQGHGLGRVLFTALVQHVQQAGKTQIRLKCPAELSANHFYQRLGLELAAVEPGKHRPLNIWSYTLGEAVVVPPPIDGR